MVASRLNHPCVWHFWWFKLEPSLAVGKETTWLGWKMAVAVGSFGKERSCRRRWRNGGKVRVERVTGEVQKKNEGEDVREEREKMEKNYFYLKNFNW